MMMMGVAELFVLMMLAVAGLPLPVSVPPLPEDPVLLSVAPRDTLAYVQWFGYADANPKSPNLTERMAADPEMREFVSNVIGALEKMVDRAAENENDAVLSHIKTVVSSLITRPGCMFLGELDVMNETVEAGLVVRLGNDRQQLVAAANAIIEEVRKHADGAELTDIDVDGVKFTKLTSPFGPPISWSLDGNYLVLAAGDSTPATVVAGMNGAPGFGENSKFTSAHGEVAIARPTTRSFIDVAGLMGMMMKTPLPPQMPLMMKGLGFMSIEAVVSESGLEGTGFTQNTMLVTPERTGVFQMFDGPALTTEELAIVPADATIATVYRADIERTMQTVLGLADQVEPGTRQFFEETVLGSANEMFGIDIRKDLLAHAGDSVAAWSAPSQGGLIFTGFTLAIELQDSEAFEKSFATMMAKAHEMMPEKTYSEYGRLERTRERLYLEQIEFRGTTIHYLNIMDDDVPVTPSWCVANGYLLASLYPQALKTMLRGEFESLASKPELLAGSPNIVSQVNTPAAFDTIYPLILPLMHLMFYEGQREGFELNVGHLPSPGAIRPHLRPEIGRVYVVENGLMATHEGTLPMADPMFGLLIGVLGGATTMSGVRIR